jgi:outer membrane lipoprotein SlyB
MKQIFFNVANRHTYRAWNFLPIVQKHWGCVQNTSIINSGIQVLRQRIFVALLSNARTYLWSTSAQILPLCVIKMLGEVVMRSFIGLVVAVMAFGVIGCSEPLTTREKGAAIGTVGGAAVGGIVGSAVGHPAAGAAIGGVAGLGTGALIGDRVQALEKKQSDLDEQIKQNELELRRQREEIEQLKQEKKER